jgi:hypothetical protein
MRVQAQAAQAALTCLYPKQIGLFPGGCPVVSVCGADMLVSYVRPIGCNIFALLMNSLWHLCCLRLYTSAVMVMVCLAQCMFIL